jgi:8-oxo-dGTP pyrophosphatase MutT (NUDIX family)
MIAQLLKQQLGTETETRVCPPPENSQRLAAVLILLVPGVDGPELVFTQRSKALPSHAGQISFPGGSVDVSDPDPIFTALRESEEEIGLIRGNVEILGTLDWHDMPSGFTVLPVVAQLVEVQDFVAEPGEVVDIFTLRLEQMLDTDCFKQDSLIINNIKINFYYIDIEGYYIWGATAAMLRKLILSLGDKARDLLQA